ncbi:MAG: hypothetical protein WB630_07645, partial [Candidatus Acidiferrales bacterium]
MTAKRATVIVAIGILTVFGSLSARPPADTLITLRIEADADSATDAREKSAAIFTGETGIQDVVEKFGYNS